MLTILGLITGLAGPLATLAGQITSLEQAKVAAQSDQERARIDAALQEAHDRRAVLVAEAGSRLNAIMRGLLAAGPTVYLMKIFIFDKVLGSFLGQTKSVFVTDPLDDNLCKVTLAVVAFYFVYDMADSWRGE